MTSELFRHVAHPCFYTQAIETILMPALWVVVNREDNVGSVLHTELKMK